LREHRPPQSAASRRACGLALLLALSACLVLLLSACGDDTPSTVANVKTTASPAAGELHAAEVVPDLKAAGFTLTQSQKPPVTTNFQDVIIAQFQKTASPAAGARVEISVLKDVETATSQFDILSAALRNPPQDLFGANTTQTDTPRSGPGDEGKAFRTANPDGQGQYVWSDAYRFGRTFVIVYVLTAASPDDALAIRKAIGDQIAAAVKAKTK
jgi:hypothetical protein